MDCWPYNPKERKITKKQNLRKIAFSKIVSHLKNNSVDLIIDSIYDRDPHPIIKESSEYKKSIACYDLETFVDLVFSDNLPVDIYYTGLHWNMCIKDRPTGWKNVLNYVNKNKLDCRILFKEKTVLAVGYNGKIFDYWPSYGSICKKIDKNIWQLNVKEHKK